MVPFVHSFIFARGRGCKKICGGDYKTACTDIYSYGVPCVTFLSNGVISPTSEPQASFTHRSISATSFFSRSRLSALFAVGSEQPEADGIPDGAAADKAYVSFARSFFRGYCKQKYFSSRYRSRGISYFFGLISRHYLYLRLFSLLFLPCCNNRCLLQIHRILHNSNKFRN